MTSCSVAVELIEELRLASDDDVADEICSMARSSHMMNVS